MLKVLVHAIEGDKGGEIFERIMRSFANDPDVTAVEAPLSANSPGTDRSDATHKTDDAIADSLKLLDQHIAVAGCYCAKSETVDIRFLVRPELRAREDPFAFASKLSLPVGDLDNLGKALVAATVTIASCQMLESDYSPFGLLDARIPDMETVIKDPPSSLPENGKRALMRLVVDALKLYHFVVDDPDYIVDAIPLCFKYHLSGDPNDLMERAWGLYTLGTLFCAHVDATGDTSYYESALRTLSEALTLYSPETTPSAWRWSIEKYARAAYIFGSREGRPDALDAAINAFKEYLSKIDPEAEPMLWSGRMIELGKAQLSLGQMMRNVDLLHKASASFDAVLTAIRRADETDTWAQAAHNLGTTFVIIGEMTGDSDASERASRVLRAALTVYDRGTDADAWSSTKHNLGLAEHAIGEAKTNIGMLQNAVAHYNEALIVRTPDHNARGWSDTQNNLGNTLRVIATLVGDVDLLHQARMAIETALTVRSPEKMPLEWAESTNNLALVLLELGRQTASAQPMHEAINLLDRAISYANEAAPKLAETLIHNRQRVAEALRDRPD